ncbi:MAG: CopG family antitoxin [bacterium]
MTGGPCPLGINVDLPPGLEELVRSKVASGLYTSASEGVREALRLPQHLLDAIKAAANARDVPYQSLIKVWLQEKVEG